MKTKFTKMAIVLSLVLTLVSSISVAGFACLLCDREEPTEPEEPTTEVVVPQPEIPNTDAYLF